MSAKPILLLCTLLAVMGLRAATLVEGSVWLKDGTVHRFTGKDRIRIPRKHGDLDAFRDAFRRKTKQRIRYRYDEIDSVVLWHSRTPEEHHTFLPTEKGWCHRILATPSIRVLLYSRVGYRLYATGGGTELARVGALRTSKIRIYLQKGDSPALRSLGRVNRRNGNAFRRRTAAFVADDPELARRIRGSFTSRKKTLLLLRDYHPRTADTTIRSISDNPISNNPISNTNS